MYNCISELLFSVVCCTHFCARQLPYKLRIPVLFYVFLSNLTIFSYFCKHRITMRFLKTKSVGSEANSSNEHLKHLAISTPLLTFG